MKMKGQNTIKHSVKKFLFDTHNFDDEIEDEEIIAEEPPPPTFSEAELEQARSTALEEGRKAGLAEAEAAREKYIAGQLERIAGDFSTLLGAEKHRADLFEAEAVALAKLIFEKTFPALNETHGLDEIKAVIDRIATAQREAPEIIITVPPDDVSAIEDHLNTLPPLAGGTWQVEGDAAQSPGCCALRWKNGGAVRDITALREQIDEELQLLLADRPVLRDNENCNNMAGQPPEQPQTDANGDGQ